MSPEETAARAATCKAVGPIAAPSDDVGALTLARLDDQICWYDQEARDNNLYAKISKFVGIAAAALIPVVTALSSAPAVIAAFGAAAVIAQATQELGQFQRNWVTFGAAREALKHERYLYLARAGDYGPSAKDPVRLLAVRVERIVGRETSGWATSLNQGADSGSG